MTLLSFFVRDSKNNFINSNTKIISSNIRDNKHHFVEITNILCKRIFRNFILYTSQILFYIEHL
jgi:hypothetical protein